MRVCYTSDLHGQPQLYQQLGEAVAAAQPNVLILGGDLLPDGDPADPIGDQTAYIIDTLAPQLADYQAAAPGLQIACLPGNHDWRPTVAQLARMAGEGRFALLNLQQAWQTGGAAWLGYHCTPWTPHWVKCFERRDLPDDPLPEAGGQVWDAATGRICEVSAAEHFGGQPTMAEELAAAARVDAPWGFVCHAPPRDSGLDRLPQVPHPIGSQAVRRFIEERQPTVALHGHVHESVHVTGAWFERIGATLCINPGQSDDRLHAVTFELDNPTATLKHTVYA